MRFIGIDPGITGAVAIINSSTIQLIDSPIVQIKTKKKPDVAGYYQILKQFTEDSTVIVEEVHAMPGQGGVSGFNFGTAFGIWIGILAALEIPYELVSPQRWKRQMGVKGDKDESRTVALQLFPHLANQLNLKKHHNRADALLIAEYNHRTMMCKL
jgi:crossover junction endodeoxyribonuclease RuvC